MEWQAFGKNPVKAITLNSVTGEEKGGEQNTKTPFQVADTPSAHGDSNNDKYLAVITWSRRNQGEDLDSDYRIYDNVTGKLLKQGVVPGWPVSATVSDDGKTMVVGDHYAVGKGAVRSVEVESGKVIAKFDAPIVANRIKYLSDGKVFLGTDISSSKTGSLSTDDSYYQMMIWDPASGKSGPTINLGKRPHDFVPSAASNGNVLVPRPDNLLQYSGDSGALLKTITIPNMTLHKEASAFKHDMTPDARFAAVTVGSEYSPHQVQIWDLEAGKKVSFAGSPNGEFQFVKFSPKSDLLVLGRRDEVCVYNTGLKARTEGGVSSASPKGSGTHK